MFAVVAIELIVFGAAPDVWGLGFGCGVWCLMFGVWCLILGVWVLRFELEVWVSEFRVRCVVFGVRLKIEFGVLGVEVLGVELRV